MEKLQEMATHGLIIHPEDPSYLTCGHHLRKGSCICWSSVEHLLAHFDEKHKRVYDEWRCKNASEPPPAEEITLPEGFDPAGVWADPPTSNPSSRLPAKFNKMPRDPMAMPRDPMAMPGIPAETEAMPSDPMAMPRDSMAMPSDHMAMPSDSIA